MNKKRIKKYLIITLLLMEALTLSLTYKSYGNKILDNVKEEYEVDKETFNMYIETKDNEGNISYEEYNESGIFPTGYKINLEKSKCTDTKGNVIDGVLSGRGNKVTITSNKTAYCYIYFDIDYTLSQLCSSGDNLGSCITDNNEEIDSLDDTSYNGMYRYTGTNEIVDDNYICFGTDDKEKCVNNPDTYMYRVIGVTSESNDTLGLETNQLKLIKHTSIGKHEWHSDYTTDTKWESSTMYTYLQNDLLNNTTYYPSGWSNKIDNIKWNIGDVQIFDTQLFADALTVYELENELQTTSESKIGLIYISDWYYSFTNTSVDCFSSSCMSWIIDKSVTNWSMTRYSYYAGGGYTRAFLIGSDGKNYIIYINDRFGVRPVFYLNNDEQYISGDGTLDNPIIISGPIMHTVNVSSNNTTYGTVIPTTQEVVDTGNATITISPNTGYKYSSNTCGIEPVDNVITLSNVISDKECTVTFEPSQYGLTLTKGTGISTIYYKINGASSYTSATSTQILNVNYGSTYYYYGTASTGYTISSCTASNPCSGTMGTSAVSKTLSATINKYTVSVSSTNTSYGTVSPASQSISHGSSATITLSPKTGYKYSSNTCGGTVSGNTMTINNITSAKTCTVTFTGIPAGTYIQSLKPTGLNTTMEGGLYRFQGASGSVNNYICVGTSIKSTCTNPGVYPNPYLYRIIGINSSEQIKIIRDSIITTTWWWHTNSYTNVTWPNSTLYTNLQNLDIISDSTWGQKLATINWKYGDNSNDNRTASSLYNVENAWTSTVSAKAGLIYLHDYYYAYQSGGLNCSVNSTAWETCAKSWLYSVPTSPSYYIPTMSRQGSSGYWGIYSGGYSLNAAFDELVFVRPVFYLNTSVSYKSGTGTSTDPFIIE